MTKHIVSLSDRYEQLTGQVFLSSMQALVRLPVDQARRDRAAGLDTGGYVTGYRGSPITTLDAQLWSSKKLLDAHSIHFEPGLNEELAATSLRGTQQIEWFGKPKHKGVFAMWYAKGLGVDRAMEALKIANFEGTHALGGVLVNAGDDPAAKSSATAHQSEHALIAALLPILTPSTTDEILAYGQYGWAMSRFSGLYVSMKTVTDALDLTSSITLPEFTPVLPELPGKPNLNIRRGLTANQQESLVINERLPAAVLFAAANRINRVDIDGEKRNLTIVTAGRSWLDVRQALNDLGLSEARCREIGLRVVKLGMVWPLDRDFLREACAGSREVLVIEEKRPVIEEQLAGALYGLSDRPAISGKRDDAGQLLLPSDGVLDATTVRRAIMRQLEAIGAADALAREAAERLEKIEALGVAPAVAFRPAYFCSGCPHNTSTRVPDGSAALGATGCHGLAVTMPERNTMTFVGMGAEGTPWIGAQHFTETKHMFSNMGDGTYTHSGLLAIRAAHAANANVTFKILYNDAVAMTGGQPLEGNIQPDQIAQELLAEGVKPVVMVSDDPDKFTGKLMPEVKIYHRDDLDKVQRELREVEGVSAIIYEQMCANEKRRRRKRGSYPDPDLRLFINPAVCEGCGDCSVQSNCVSVQPLDTEFGRKRQIDQSNCNKDYSCVKGYCPSFVSVRGATLAKKALDMSGLAPWIEKLPQPAVVDISDSYSMLVTGIGGTGVLTVGAILGTAAHMEGKAAKLLDMTGMAQKGGGVMSHVRFSDDVANIPSARLGTGQADLLIACDLIVASGPDVAKSVRPETRVIANADVVPTGEFQRNKDLDLRASTFLGSIEKRVDAKNVALVNANLLAAKLLGDTIFTNLMMVGYAAQMGLLPVELDSIEEAVKLNGTAVKANLQALTLGRIAAAFPEELIAFAGVDARPAYPQTLDELLASRRQHLINYQDEAYARQYDAFIAQVQAKLVARGVSDTQPFMMAVANELSRFMAYKDEYEVARLYSDPRFKVRLGEQFAGDYKIALNLGAPYLTWKRDKKTGRPKKVELPSWFVLPLFNLMAKFKGLRGGPLDLFGYAAERRMERRMIGEYRDLILGLADRVTSRTLPIAARIADSAALISGYGPVKEKGVEAYEAQVKALLAELDAAEAGPVETPAATLAAAS